MRLRAAIKSAFSRGVTIVKAATDRAVAVASPLKSEPGFDPHSNYDLYEKLYYTDPDAALAVDTIAMLAVGGGITFHSRKEQTARWYEEWAKRVRFKGITENNIKTHLIFGNAYNIPVEPEKRENMVEIQVLHPAHVKIETDETGRVIKYIHDPEKLFNEGGRLARSYEPDQIMHFRHNIIANNVYGISLYHPAYDILETLRRVEVTAADLAHRDAHRLLWAKVSPRSNQELATNPDTGKPYLQEKIDTLKELLSNRVEEREDGRTYKVSNTIVTDDTVAISDLAASHNWSGLVQLLKHLQDKSHRALRVPPVFLGVAEGSNRATSYNQLRTFKKYIEGIQENIIEEYERVLLPLLPGDVDIEFEIPIAEDDSIWAEVAALLYDKGIMTLDEAREYVGLPSLNEEEPVMPRDAPQGTLKALHFDESLFR